MYGEVVIIELDQIYVDSSFCKGHKIIILYNLL